MDPRAGLCPGLEDLVLGFLFYVSFGVVITLSVEIAGVLMVFSYLVAPTIIALGSSNRWVRGSSSPGAVGFLASAAGLIASYQADFPSGPAIVCSLGLFLLLFGAWQTLRRKAVSSP